MLFLLSVLSHTLDHPPSILAGLALITLLYYMYPRRSSYMNNIPTAYVNIPIIMAIRCILNTQDYIREGYRKTKARGGLFRLAGSNRWVVVTSGPAHTRDLYRAREAEVSAYTAIDEVLQFSHTLSPTILKNPYHLPLLLSHLGKHLTGVWPDIVDELEYVFSISPIGCQKSSTNTTPVAGISGSDFVKSLVARLSNRIFVGKTLCRNTEYLNLVSVLAFRNTKSGFILSSMPPWLRSLITPLIAPKRLRKTTSLLEPEIRRRKQLLDSASEQLDFLTNLIRLAKGDELTSEALTLRILHLNFAALASTSTILTIVLGYLASCPTWQEDILAEVQTVVSREGFTFIALSGMVKLDSMVKEVLRFHHYSITTIGRVVINSPFVFSDGTSIPVGTLMCAASREIALEQFGDTFDPFQFYRSSRDGVNLPTRCTTSTPEFLPWGHGKHVCPGRFFAECLIKAVVAYSVLHYKISTKNQRTPTTGCFFVITVPDKELNLDFEPRLDPDTINST